MSITARTALPTGVWTVDPGHSNVEFSAKHLGIVTVRGAFKEFEGSIDVGDDGSTRARGTVQAASLDTNEETRDAHLRSEEFFHAEVHPELVFESREIRPLDEDTFEIHGDLTMRGVTRPVILTAEVHGTDIDPWGNERVGLELHGQLNRGDWGMTFNQVLASGNKFVSDKVKLSLDISAIKQSSEGPVPAA
jgi:polyisoprenoid-binding protein YceI